MLKVIFNEEEKEFQILYDEKVITNVGFKDIDILVEEFNASFQRAKNSKKAHAITYREKIYLEYLELDASKYNYKLEDIIELRLNICWDYGADWSDGYVEAITENGDSFRLIEGIDTNFSKEELCNNFASSHEIRACLGEDLLIHIEKNPDFKLIFCKQEIPHKVLLDTGIERFYDFLPPVGKRSDSYYYE